MGEYGDTSVHDFNELLFGLFSDHFLVHTNFTKLVLDNGKLHAMILKEALDECHTDDPII